MDRQESPEAGSEELPKTLKSLHSDLDSQGAAAANHGRLPWTSEVTPPPQQPSLYPG